MDICQFLNDINSQGQEPIPMKSNRGKICFQSRMFLLRNYYLYESSKIFDFWNEEETKAGRDQTIFEKIRPDQANK